MLSWICSFWGANCTSQILQSLLSFLKQERLGGGGGPLEGPRANSALWSSHAISVGLWLSVLGVGCCWIAPWGFRSRRASCQGPGRPEAGAGEAHSSAAFLSPDSRLTGSMQVPAYMHMVGTLWFSFRKHGHWQHVYHYLTWSILKCFCMLYSIFLLLLLLEKNSIVFFSKRNWM